MKIKFRINNNYRQQMKNQINNNNLRTSLLFKKFNNIIKRFNQK